MLQVRSSNVTGPWVLSEEFREEVGYGDAQTIITVLSERAGYCG